MAGHVVPAVVGAIVVAELELPLALKNGELDGACRGPLGLITLHR
jgi:hypothetical protein